MHRVKYGGPLFALSILGPAEDADVGRSWHGCVEGYEYSDYSWLTEGLMLMATHHLMKVIIMIFFC